MKHSVNSILQKPYPRDHRFLVNFRAALATGLIVSFFLWIFKPFGISGAPVSNLDFFILGYGAVSFFIVVGMRVFTYLFPGFYNEDRWTVEKNIFQYSLVLFVVGLGNLVYTHYAAGLPISKATFIFFQLYTVSVAFIISAILTFWNYFRTEHLNKLFAEKIDREIHSDKQLLTEKKFIIRPESETGELEFSNRSLLFIESADNYAKIYFLKSGKAEMKMIRGSLKRIGDQLNYPFIFRCHRSYIVNLENVSSVKGNSQGYRLYFPGLDETVPVSRRTGEELHARLKSVGTEIGAG